MRAVRFGLALGLVVGLPMTRSFAQGTPIVVELFTSQGCSSCPPADAFLTDLARQRHDILPLAFHVTYWDDFGWKDPYSLEAATDRQRAYARGLGDDRVYTPEMVVNGAYSFVGSRRDEGLDVISHAVHGGAATVPLRLSRDGERLVIAVGGGVGSAQVLLVGFDPERQTRVGRGENGGRTLLESNIVRSLTSAGGWTGSAIELRQAMPAGEQFAVLLQADDGRILGAARLSKPAS
jgi:hypothetical protein